MEKDELGNEHPTKVLTGKGPIWQEDQLINGRIGKGPIARGRKKKDEMGEDEVAWYPCL